MGAKVVLRILDPEVLSYTAGTAVAEEATDGVASGGADEAGRDSAQLSEPTMLSGTWGAVVGRWVKSGTASSVRGEESTSNCCRATLGSSCCASTSYPCLRRMSSPGGASGSPTGWMSVRLGRRTRPLFKLGVRLMARLGSVTLAGEGSAEKGLPDKKLDIWSNIPGFSESERLIWSRSLLASHLKAWLRASDIGDPDAMTMLNGRRPSLAIGDQEEPSRELENMLMTSPIYSPVSLLPSTVRHFCGSYETSAFPAKRLKTNVRI